MAGVLGTIAFICGAIVGWLLRSMRVEPVREPHPMERTEATYVAMKLHDALRHLRDAQATVQEIRDGIPAEPADYWEADG